METVLFQPRMMSESGMWGQRQQSLVSKILLLKSFKEPYFQKILTSCVLRRMCYLSMIWGCRKSLCKTIHLYLRPEMRLILCKNKEKLFWFQMIKVMLWNLIQKALNWFESMSYTPNYAQKQYGLMRIDSYLLGMISKCV